MRKIQCDNINVKILLNENDALKAENDRLKRELWEVKVEQRCFNTVTVPLLKSRLEFEREKMLKIPRIVYALTFTIGISSGHSTFMGIYDSEESAIEVRDKHLKKYDYDLRNYQIVPIEINKEVKETFMEW